MRGSVWPALCGLSGRDMHISELYSQLSTSPGDDDSRAVEALAAIDLDVDRTWPRNERMNTSTRAALRRVLVALARAEPEIGYCQGLNEVTAMLLLFAPDEPCAFGMLLHLVRTVLPADWYGRSLAGSVAEARLLGELVREREPAIGAHMAALHVEPSLFCTAWFLCLFLGSLPFGVALRCWDCVLLAGAEGPSALQAGRGADVLLRLSLALLRLHKPALLRAQHAGAFVRALVDGARATHDADVLLRAAFRTPAWAVHVPSLHSHSHGHGQLHHGRAAHHARHAHGAHGDGQEHGRHGRAGLQLPHFAGVRIGSLPRLAPGAAFPSHAQLRHLRAKHRAAIDGEREELRRRREAARAARETEAEAAATQATAAPRELAGAPGDASCLALRCGRLWEGDEGGRPAEEEGGAGGEERAQDAEVEGGTGGEERAQDAEVAAVRVVILTAEPGGVDAAAEGPTATRAQHGLRDSPLLPPAPVEAQAAVEAAPAPSVPVLPTSEHADENSRRHAADQPGLRAPAAAEPGPQLLRLLPPVPMPPTACAARTTPPVAVTASTDTLRRQSLVPSLGAALGAALAEARGQVARVGHAFGFAASDGRNPARSTRGSTTNIS